MIHHTTNGWLTKPLITTNTTPITKFTKFTTTKTMVVTGHPSSPQEQTFIRAGGEKAWLAGQVGNRFDTREKKNHNLPSTQKDYQLILLPTHFVGQVPARLRRLEPVNAVLAHRPSALSPAHIKVHSQLDPVGSTVHYKMMKLCTGSV